MANSPNIYQKRQAKLAETLRETDLKAMVLNPGPSLVYLTGLRFHLSERPVVVVFTATQDTRIVLPELEAGKTAGLSYPIQSFPYGESPEQWHLAFKQAFKAGETSLNTIGYEPRQLRLLEYHYLLQAAPRSEFTSAEECLSQIRMVKDAEEITAMQKAVTIAQQALNATLPMIKPGITERQIAGELTLHLLRHGSEAEIPFSPIVSGGPNSANPHATPTDRPLSHGDLMVIDWGACYQGYYSDITRTFAIGEIEPEYAQICKLVLEANAAGRAAARPGVPAEQVDQAARAVIEAGGYGKYFTHRTGHGLGIEGHEHPYIRAGNTQLLEPGMTFTIEPGIYLPGRNGVRIEDDMVITDQGAESLTDLPREVVRLV